MSQTIDLVNHSHWGPGPWDPSVFSADCEHSYFSKKRFRFYSTTFLSRHFGRCVACEQSIFSTTLNLSSRHLARSFESTPQRVPVRRPLNFHMISTTRPLVLSVRSYACGGLHRMGHVADTFWEALSDYHLFSTTMPDTICFHRQGRCA